MKFQIKHGIVKPSEEAPFCRGPLVFESLVTQSGSPFPPTGSETARRGEPEASTSKPCPVEGSPTPRVPPGDYASAVKAASSG
jgi:hypothetical protein